MPTRAVARVRDRQTGRFVSLVKIPGGPWLLSSGGRVLSQTAKRPARAQAVRVPLPTPRAPGPRHPRTGRFITTDEAAFFRKRTITPADVSRVIRQSAKLARVYQGATKSTRRAIRQRVRADEGRRRQTFRRMERERRQ